MRAFRPTLALFVVTVVVSGCMVPEVDLPPESPVPCHVDCEEPTPEEQRDALPRAVPELDGDTVAASNP